MLHLYIGNIQNSEIIIWYISNTKLYGEKKSEVQSINTESAYFPPINYRNIWNFNMFLKYITTIRYLESGHQNDYCQMNYQNYKTFKNLRIRFYGIKWCLSTRYSEEDPESTLTPTAGDSQPQHSSFWSDTLFDLLHTCRPVMLIHTLRHKCIET